MKLLALVTARGGSKGFPGKNLALLAGRPLVAWSHEALARFRTRHPGTRLFLSTDSGEIAAAWPEADRPQRLRPSALAADDTPSLDVVRHELAMADQEGFVAEGVLLLQPTSPLIGAEDLEAAYRILQAEGGAVVGMCPLEHPVQWARFLREDGILEPVLPGPLPNRRQACRPALRPVGFYLAERRFLEEHGAFLVDGLSRGSLVPAARAVDIDSPQDLDVARALGFQPRRPFAIGSRGAGDGHPCLVIAEAGVNHNGDPGRAAEMVRAAARAGADAVKFQTFRAEALVTAGAPKAAYQARNTGGAGGQLEMLRALELGREALFRLQAVCREEGILFLSSPFDLESARLLADLGVPAFKVGSGELTNLPFLRELGRLGRPMILSTGMADLGEVLEACEALRSAGDPPVALLHCVSAYPAPPADYNLRAMATLESATGCPSGLSDHAPGWHVSLGAVALGARILEKHFTLDRALPGPDHAASLEPEELALMVRQVRELEASLGDGVKRPAASELDTRQAARKSIVAARALEAGGRIAAGDLACKRPGTGLSPARLDEVIGRRLLRGLAPDDLLDLSDLEA